MEYWRIGQMVYSHFLIENWKVKMLGTITAHINIDKPNETVIKYAFYIILLKIKFYKDVVYNTSFTPSNSNIPHHLITG